MAEQRTIAVIGGTGQEGGGLAARFAHAGHRVIIGSRDADKAADAAARLNEKVGADRVSGHTNADAVAAADLVVLAVPYQGQKHTALSLKEALAGKILVDATVPLVPPKVARVQLPEGGSAVAAIQVLLGPEVKVVSAFQNVSWNHLIDLDHAIDCDVLVCGDDNDACDTVVALIGEIGMRGFHAGPIVNSAAAEALTSLLISINRRYKSSGSGIRITAV
ncbi:NADPH-dependent F420 reductase [Microvirga sp. SRT01]|uniref:NADPH-dependent F420 reductase n=1 Tax=Sphingomonas longa TaxID=2778730 RepID=A0ABS2DA59_9SPHN|nr:MULTISPECIES: NADPH-dependent F420 reductase [Alphaproteobacteria]MBM6577810.1 NADPH-dependent F420 reductase [Sphingomonas sp. BT552]MBR7710852.1 NADPH-dependent F420 reductase [Microvirga sp. SRT01]